MRRVIRVYFVGEDEEKERRGRANKEVNSMMMKKRKGNERKMGVTKENREGRKARKRG